MRKLLVGGNWKCNGTVAFAKEFPQKVLNTIKYDHKKVEVVVAPAQLHLTIAKENVKNHIFVSAQNISQFKNGAYTGEVSAEMLNDLGLHWTILGHSERRHVFGESEEVIGKKVKIALDHKLKVIACIGEQLKEREGG
jgi:triosephosphate isomerase